MAYWQVLIITPLLVLFIVMFLVILDGLSNRNPCASSSMDSSDSPGAPHGDGATTKAGKSTPSLTANS